MYVNFFNQVFLLSEVILVNINLDNCNFAVLQINFSKLISWVPICNGQFSSNPISVEFKGMGLQIFNNDLILTKEKICN